MTIEIIVDNETNGEAPVTYPLLRRWFGKGDGTPLVVLFTSLREGVALSHSDDERIGVSEDWIEHTHEDWRPCTITLGAKD